DPAGSDRFRRPVHQLQGDLGLAGEPQHHQRRVAGHDPPRLDVAERCVEGLGTVHFAHPEPREQGPHAGTAWSSRMISTSSPITILPPSASPKLTPNSLRRITVRPAKPTRGSPIRPVGSKPRNSSVIRTGRVVPRRVRSPASSQPAAVGRRPVLVKLI